MCIVVVVASDQRLPISPPDQSFLFQSQLLLAGSEPVQRLFSKPYVYGLSSVGGCACGFAYSPYDLEVLSDADVPVEMKDNVLANHKASRQSVHLLHDFLRLAVGVDTAEVYSCWYGDEEIEPETRLDVDLDHFGGHEFHFIERQFLTVHGEQAR